MSNKIVTLITGSRKGIGKYLAEYYVNLGHDVIGCSRAEVDWSLPNYRHILADVANEKEVAALFKVVREEYGYIDNMINNAGIALEYTDSTKKQHRINERGHTDIDSVSGEYGEFVSFTEDSTMYWVKKEFEDIQRMEVRERAKRKNLEGGL